MSLTGRKTSLLEDAAGQVLREFQALVESEPARERAQSYSRGEGAGEEGPGQDSMGRRRSSTFTQMKSKGYLERVKERRAETAQMVFIWNLVWLVLVQLSATWETYKMIESTLSYWWNCIVLALTVTGLLPMLI